MIALIAILLPHSAGWASSSARLQCPVGIGIPRTLGQRSRRAFFFASTSMVLVSMGKKGYDDTDTLQFELSHV
ncbi:hypothetical protein BDW02DRAFT_570245, partial [Decorospora gaudefroyi]